MSKVSLYIPKINDYWYEEKILSDSSTMSYNSGYNVSYFGYHYDTGCIDFPKDKWNEKYDKRNNNHKVYFAYLKNNETGDFVGTVGYHFDEKSNRYECSIIIESIYRGLGFAKIGLSLLCDVAKANGIDELYDSFETNRGNTLNLFKNLGFEVVESLTWKKFDVDVSGVVVRKRL